MPHFVIGNTSCRDHTSLVSSSKPLHVTHVNHVFYGVKEWRIVLCAIIEYSMLSGYPHFLIDIVQDDLKNEVLSLGRYCTTFYS